MKNKSRIRIILIALLVIVISLSVGFGTWIISNYINTKPNNSENTVNKVITKYLDGTSTTFDGNIQLPIPKKFNNYLELDPKDVTYFYKPANSTEDYTECIENEKGPQNAGEYLIQVRYQFTDTDIFEVSGLKFTIHKRTIDDSNTTIVFDDVCTYNSKEQKPTFTVTIKFDSKTFILDETDFDTTYSKNINATTNAQAEMTSKNVNFDGTFTKTFTINQYDLSKNKDSVDVQLNNSYTYIGTRIDPSFTIKVTFSSNSAVEQLTSGKDYTTTGYTNASTNAPYVITGAGNYKGTLNGTFVINKANPSITTIPTFDAIYEGEFDSGFPTITNGKATLNGVEVKGTFIFNNVVNTYNITGSDKNYYFDSKGTTTSAGFTNYISYTFIPEDQNNFNSVTKSDATILIKSVAFNGSTYYGSIEHALNAVTSGTINVIASIDEGRIIRTNCTIKSGVTLQFLYSGATTIIKDTTNYYPSETKKGNRTYALDNPATYRKNLIYIDENITLTNNGTIIIGGIISSGNGGGAPNCQTCDSYAEIILLEQSSIINNSGSKFINYGAVKDKTNANGEIIFNNGSLSQTPFIVIEHRGGSIFSGIYSNLKGAAFNRFFFQNFVSTTKFNYGSQFIGYANLYASSQDNETLIKVVGASSNYLLEMKANSYFFSKYNNSSKVNTIDIYGDINLNSLNMSVAGQNISTSSVFFPLSWYFNVSLNVISGSNSNVTLKQDVKIMPGAIVKINKNVYVTAKNLIVYDTFNDISVGAPIYPTNKPNGKLIVDGQLTIQSGGSIGGLISTTGSGAQMTIADNASTTATSYEIASKSGSGFLTTVKWNEYKREFTIYQYTQNGVSAYPVAGGTGTMYSKDGGWYSTTISINYDSCGGTNVDSKDNLQINESGFIFTNEYLPTPTRQYYTFAGWYLDSNYNNKIEAGDSVYCSVTLYAKWIPVEYEINYIDKYKDNFASGNTSTSENPNTFNVESNFALVTPINGEYVFGGWYTDESCSTKVTIIDGSKLITLLDANNKVSLYALWHPIGTKKYIINYTNSNNNVVCIANDSIIANDNFDWSTVELPDLSIKDNDFSENLYFGGWYNNDVQITSVNESLFVNTPGTDEYVLNLTARWITKNTLILTIPSCNTSYGTIAEINLTMYYKPGTSFTIPSLEDKGVILNQGTDKGDILIDWVSNDGSRYKVGDILTLNNQTNITANIQKYLKISVGTNDYTTVTITFTANKGYFVTYDGTKATATQFNGETITNGGSKLITANSEFMAKYTVSGGESNSAAITNVTKTDGSAISNLTTSDIAFKVKDPNTLIQISPAGNDSTCIIEGTLITLADGTKKKVEDLLLTDKLLVFNHNTGTYDIGDILFINNHNNIFAEQRILNLEFSDGSMLRIVENHGLFDLETLKYEYIDEYNYENYINHRFYKGTLTGENYESGYATLINAYVTVEKTRIFAIITAGYMNSFTNDFISMPTMLSYSNAIVNIFDYNENLMYDQEKMMSDIEKYGLYTYDDFKHLITYESFMASPAMYLKVAIGKGYITEEEILICINYLLNNGLIQ